MILPCLQTCPGLDQAFFRAHQNFPDGGTILEFGVGGGYSYSWMSWWVKNKYTSDHLVGFDSWQGLPKETEGVWFPECHKEGNYKHEKRWVYIKTKELEVDIVGDPRFEFVDGFFDQTLTPELQSKIGSVILINMDVDLHSSTVLVLDWIVPLLQVGTIIYTDDWHFPVFGIDPKIECGASLAFKQWSLRNPRIKLATFGVFPDSQRCFEVQSLG